MEFVYKNLTTNEILVKNRPYCERDSGCGKNIIRLQKYFYLDKSTNKTFSEFNTDEEKDLPCNNNIERYIPSFHIGDGVVFSNEHKTRQARLETEVFDKVIK